MKSLSIVIPMLNEVDLVENALVGLHSLLKEFKVEGFPIDVIIVDAGSGDGSAEAASKMAGEFGWKFKSQALSSPSIGKTIQLSFDLSESEYVLILPVDCQLSLECLSLLKEFDSDYGGFFKNYSPATLLLNIYGFLQNYIRTLALKNVVWTNGIIVKREFLDEENVFCTEGFMEDVLFSDNLKRRTSSFKVMKTPVRVSSRLYFAKTPIVRVLINGFIMSLFRAGFKDPKKLRRIYRFARD